MNASVKEIWNACCPKCRDDQHIDIQALVWVRLCPEGTDAGEAANGDHEWDQFSDAVCAGCGHHGTVAEFTVAGEMP